MGFDPLEGREEHRNSGDRVFLAFISVLVVVFAVILTGIAISIVIAMWQAGFINFLVWSGICISIAWASRLVYRTGLKKDWMDRF